MLKRQVFRDVIKQKLQRVELAWLARRALTYLRLKFEARVRSGYSPAPLMAVCVLTDNCNLRCPMCDLPARFQQNPHQRSTAEWRRTIAALAELGTAGVGFTGGEVTLRDDLFELIAYARRLGMPVTLNTNALALTGRRLEALLAAAPTNINISIDSGSDEVNDRLRGGTRILERTLSRIDELTKLRSERGADFTLTVVTVLCDQNIGDLERLFSRLSGSGVDRIGFMPLHDISTEACQVARLEADSSSLAEDLRALSRQYQLPLENSRSYLEDFHALMSGASVMPVACNAGYTSIVIGPDFKLYRCWPFYEKQQSFCEWKPEVESLRQVWNDERYRHERVAALSCKECFWNCHAELSYLVPM